jgi:hypothetical protein
MSFSISSSLSSFLLSVLLFSQLFLLSHSLSSKPFTPFLTSSRFSSVKSSSLASSFKRIKKDDYFLSKFTSVKGGADTENLNKEEKEQSKDISQEEENQKKVTGEGEETEENAPPLPVAEVEKLDLSTLSTEQLNHPYAKLLGAKLMKFDPESKSFKEVPTADLLNGKTTALFMHAQVAEKALEKHGLSRFLPVIEDIYGKVLEK